MQFACNCQKLFKKVFKAVMFASKTFTGYSISFPHWKVQASIQIRDGWLPITTRGTQYRFLIYYILYLYYIQHYIQLSSPIAGKDGLTFFFNSRFGIPRGVYYHVVMVAGLEYSFSLTASSHTLCLFKQRTINMVVIYRKM